MTQLENYLSKQVADIGFNYTGLLVEENDYYFFNARAGTHGAFDFTDTKFIVTQIHHTSRTNLSVILKIKSSDVKHCIDKVTPLN